jgi:hypothetical protein
MSKSFAIIEESGDDVAGAAVLPLDAPRSVAFKAGKGAFIFRFRRIRQEDWQEYFLGIVNQIIQTGDSRENVFETESAILGLVENTLTSVEGYGDLSGLKNWKQSLPLRHRIAAGLALRSVIVSPPKEDAPILCDEIEVKLDANWGAADGKTIQYSGLVHRFRQPSIADLKKFNFESARTRVRGTADAGVTTYPSRQAIGMKIYDDLIVSVDGYSSGGSPLIGAEAIKREMDGAHKAAAALAIFDRDEEIVVE